MQSLLSLHDILSGDKNTLKYLKIELAEKGWAFVRMQPELVKTVRDCIDPLQNFFSLDVSEKEKYHWNYVFGYTSVIHKESLRWFTKDRFDPELIPPNCKETISRLTVMMDDLMPKLVIASGKILIGTNKPSAIAEKLHLPLLLENDSVPKWAMLDVAHYFNDQSKFDESPLPPDINCDSHYDPGFISLSVLSTAPGLELFNPATDTWIAHTGEDESLAVLWCGKAASDASKGVLKPAIHRVLRKVGQPRMAMWYEICTAEQEPKPSQKDYDNIMVQVKTQDLPVLQFNNKKNTNNSKNKFSRNERPPTIKGEEEILKNHLLKTEKKTGIPRTKKGKGGLTRKKNIN